MGGVGVELSAAHAHKYLLPGLAGAWDKPCSREDTRAMRAKGGGGGVELGAGGSTAAPAYEGGPTCLPAWEGPQSLPGQGLLAWRVAGCPGPRGFHALWCGRAMIRGRISFLTPPCGLLPARVHTPHAPQAHAQRKLHGKPLGGDLRFSMGISRFPDLVTSNCPS